MTNTTYLDVQTCTRRWSLHPEDHKRSILMTCSWLYSVLPASQRIITWTKWKKLRVFRCLHPLKLFYSKVYIKSVRFWSCPLSPSWGRIIPRRPCMPKWAQTCEKLLSQGGLEPTTSRFRGWSSTNWATADDDYMRSNCGIGPKCGYAVYSQ